MPGGNCARNGGPCGGRGLGRLYRFAEPLILLSLCRRGRAYGYELLDEVNQTSLSDQEASIDTGVLYRTLRALEAAGLVVSDWDTGGSGAARRFYELTDAGVEHLALWTEHLERISDAMAATAARARSVLAERGAPA
jgi:DNA-binding PadR family transcriptional regulator